MRPDNQDTVAATAERHQGRHGQQTAFTREISVRAWRSIQWDTKTLTTIATYTSPQLPQNVATINRNELEPYTITYFLMGKARIMSVSQDLLQRALHDVVQPTLQNDVRPALESIDATSKLIATIQQGLEDLRSSLRLSHEASLCQQ